MRCATCIIFKGDCGYGGDRSFGESLSQIDIFRLTFSQAGAPAVIMDHDVEMIRVIPTAGLARFRGHRILPHSLWERVNLRLRTIRPTG
jgi:hypothetical protein